MDFLLTPLPTILVMEASFHQGDEQILYRLIMIFGRIPNRVNIR